MSKKKVLGVLSLIMVITFVTNCFAPIDRATVPEFDEPVIVMTEELAYHEREAYLSVPPQEDEPEDEPEDGAAADGYEDAEDAEEEEEEEAEPECTIVTITISAIGDMTLGGDPRFSNQFIREFERNDQDHSFFLSEVRHIFEADDLTLANLEGALTEASAHKPKTFVFRGPPHFAKILSSSGVDAVSLANNHTHDFYDVGYQDTIDALEAEGVNYFGNDKNTIMEINGIKVGLFGFTMWENNQRHRDRIRDAIDDLRSRGAQLVIAFYHWGVESANRPSGYQIALGRYTIDNGADLVLGAHPHVLQGIEVYEGKNIVYSLANFSFGGNNNPADHHTFIFQQTFTFDDGVLQDTNETNIIPAFISSVRNRNNFQPIVAEGEDAERILQRMRTYSEWLE